MDDARTEKTGGGSFGPLYPKLRPGPGLSPEQVATNQRSRIQGALIELVATQGYADTTVRELVEAAGVSKRTFYRHFPGREGCSGKEECLLVTYDELVRRLAERVQAVRKPDRDCREQLRLGFGAFVTKLTEARKAAMLALVEVQAASPATRRRSAKTTILLESMLRDAFACEPDGVALPPELAKGIVAGAARVSRARLLAGSEAELPDLCDDLTDWALGFRDEAVERLAALQVLPPVGLPGRRDDRRLAPADADDRALILAATARLAVADGFKALTVPRIRAMAGVSRKRFDANFEGVTDCFLAMLDREVGAVLAESTLVLRTARDWRLGVYRALDLTCARITDNAGIARLAFFEVLEAGRPGIRWRAELVGELARRFRAGAPPEMRPGEVASEASLGAVWSLIHYVVTTGRRRELPNLIDSLAMLLLVPACGAPAALAAIEVARNAERLAGKADCKSDRNYLY